MSKIELLMSDVEVNEDPMPDADTQIHLRAIGFDVAEVIAGVKAVDILKDVIREGRCIIVTNGIAYQANLDAVMVQEELELAQCSENDCPCNEFN